MPDLTLAVAQSLPEPDDLASSIDQHLTLAAAAASAGATLIVFPELSLTGYHLGLSRMNAIAPSDARIARLQALANLRDAVLVVGAPVLSSAGLHIGALIFAPHQAVRTHLKVHLHPGEEVAFVPGPPSEPLRLGAEVVGLAICADITHPEHAQTAAALGSTIYAAGCFLTPTGYATDSQLLGGYARRYGLTVLMANFGAPSGRWPSAGRSAIWSPQGHLLVQGPAAGAAVLLARRTSAGWQSRVLLAGGTPPSRGLTTA
jgi:predicted amidohydrolase